MKEFTSPFSNIPLALSSERHFSEALTRWNYFPNQKDSASELPPCFTTRRFTPEIAVELSKMAVQDPRKQHWFDLVEYRVTRYNNVSRTLSLLHPLAYARLHARLMENHEEISNLTSSNQSAIKIEEHIDGRMIIMNYESHEARTSAALEDTFGKRFRAHTDISNCFGSVYTHSLEWAIQGYDEAKKNLFAKPKHWSSILDTAFRNTKRNETSGLPIGPAASNIAVEIILCKIDKILEKQNFIFTRYIDDYTAYCESHDEAQDFIRILGHELASYRLSLNLNKTTIKELPESLQDPWTSILNNALPKRTSSDGALSLSTSEAINFLDFAVRLNKETPDGSVLRYAISTIAPRAIDETAVAVFNYTLNLAWHFPALLPLLEKIDARSDQYDVDATQEKLNKIITANALHRRSDGMCWALYYIKQLSREPGEEQIKQVLNSKDCAAITMLCKFNNSIGQAKEHALGIISNATLYELDQNWLLLYELFLHNHIDNPYQTENTFDILKKYDVAFLYPADKSSHAEQYCHVISNPFQQPRQPVSFDQWMQRCLAPRPPRKPLSLFG
ncbi:antiviral reverse transcriptase Drt4 [Pseudomonas sp. GTC 16482]|uniref:antiviral reverse transcriptase Drt4 n=1 Tax=Pseudomonas sp. GTC 16482 TaxID=1661693 RepID=UPI0007621DB2|nr:antiviral reverse transcriptase Drt4 [Pseudomonas sp. GTC 16482]